MALSAIPISAYLTRFLLRDMIPHVFQFLVASSIYHSACTLLNWLVLRSHKYAIRDAPRQLRSFEAPADERRHVNESRSAPIIGSELLAGATSPLGVATVMNGV
jgi:hypothetical protein